MVVGTQQRILAALLMLWKDLGFWNAMTYIHVIALEVGYCQLIQTFSASVSHLSKTLLFPNILVSCED